MPTYEWNKPTDQPIIPVIVLEATDPIPTIISDGTVIIRKASDIHGEVSTTVTVWNV